MRVEAKEEAVDRKGSSTDYQSKKGPHSLVDWDKAASKTSLPDNFSPIWLWETQMTHTTH